MKKREVRLESLKGEKFDSFKIHALTSFESTHILGGTTPTNQGCEDEDCMIDGNYIDSDCCTDACV